MEVSKSMILNYNWRREKENSIFTGFSPKRVQKSKNIFSPKSKTTRMCCYGKLWRNTVLLARVSGTTIREYNRRNLSPSLSNANNGWRTRRKSEIRSLIDVWVNEDPNCLQYNKHIIITILVHTFLHLLTKIPLRLKLRPPTCPVRVWNRAITRIQKNPYRAATALFCCITEG